jgi:ribose 5-phosphate isomerase A
MGPTRPHQLALPRESLKLEHMKDQHDAEKRTVAEAALRWVQTGMRLGLGSGSTSHWFIKLLGERVRGGDLSVKGIATSRDSEELARESGITLITPRRGLVLDLDLDGADEIAPDLSLIKGGGGALLREKAVARASRYFLVLADASKQVQHLGAFRLPVEVIPFTLPWVMDEIAKIGGNPILRMIPGSVEQPYLTDQQNYILDCNFEVIEFPANLATQLEKIPGIAAHGLFLGYANAALISHGSSVLVLRPNLAAESIETFQALP